MALSLDIKIGGSFGVRRALTPLSQLLIEQ